MTLVQLLFLAVGFFIVGWLAYFIINKFFPADLKMPAFLVVGVLLLLGLLSVFFPVVSNIKVW